MSDRLIIFDTTLRDGEQSPGASMTAEEKMRIARQLERLKVDVIEAGFPASSVGDFEAVRVIAQTIKDSTVCGLARANESDVRRAGEALKGVSTGRIHTFIASSPIHMKMKLRMTPEQVLEQAVRSVRWACEYTDDVEFSPEDAGRSELDFLCRLLEAVIAAGATTVNIPDTVGYTMPWQFGELIKNLRERVPNSDKAVWSVHCHNDLGMAVANSVAAVMNGARQVECTINGLGERAGNASLEEIVMAVRTRKDVFPCKTRIDTTQIVAASKLVSGITGFPVQPNKAIVGANAFAHESGIHQDGVLKHRETYEIMRAQDVGWNANKLTLGKLSGRNAFRTHLAEIGIEFKTEDAFNAAFVKFKELADKKGEVFDEDLHALASDEAITPEVEYYKLNTLKVVSETGTTPHARIAIGAGDSELIAETDGDGPVDATFKAIERLVQLARQAAAVLGQCDHHRHRRAGRGHGAPGARWPHRQRAGRRYRYPGRVGQGLHQRAEQAAQQAGAVEPAIGGVRFLRTPRTGE